MRNIRSTASKTLLVAGLASVAIIGGACAENQGGVSPGQEAPAEDPFAPDGGTTAGDDAGTTTTGGGTTTGMDSGATTAG